MLLSKAAVAVIGASSEDRAVVVTSGMGASDVTELMTNSVVESN